VEKEIGAVDPLMLTLLAHLSAHRRLLINLYTSTLMDEPGAVRTAEALRETFAKTPTQAPERGSGIDPATSDLLAAMTDEAIEYILDRVIAHLRQSCKPDNRPLPSASTWQERRLSGGEA
jgi:hypothetical protein